MPLQVPQPYIGDWTGQRGKAIRQELATAKKEEELLGLQIEAFKNPPVDTEEQRKAANHMKDSMAEALAAAELVRREGGDEGQWTEAFNSTMAMSLPPEAVEAAIQNYDKNGDGILGPDELDQGVAFAISRGQELAEKGGTTILSLDEKLAMGMKRDWAENSVVERDETGDVSVTSKPTGMTAEDLAARGDKTETHMSGAVADFEETGIGAVGAVQTGTELVEISWNDPAGMGKTGALFSFGNEWVTFATNVADQLGYDPIEAADRVKQDAGVDAFDWGMSEDNINRMTNNAVEAAAFKAGVYGIAFASAVSEQGTRPTDKDIQQFIDQIGGRLTSPEAFRRTIAQFMGRQDRRLKAIASIKGIPQSAIDRIMGAWEPAYAAFQDSLIDPSKRVAQPQRAEDLPGFADMSPEDQAELKRLMGQ